MARSLVRVRVRSCRALPMPQAGFKPGVSSDHAGRLRTTSSLAHTDT